MAETLYAVAEMIAAGDELRFVDMAPPVPLPAAEELAVALRREHPDRRYVIVLVHGGVGQ